MTESDGRERQRTDKTEDCLDDFRKRFENKIRDPKFALEVAGFIVLFVYAVFTILMYFVNRDAANAATSAAKTAKDTLDVSKEIQAARLAFSMSPVITPLAKGSGALIDWNPTITNIGQTLAMHINISADYIDLRGSNGQYGEPSPIPGPIPNPSATGGALPAGKSDLYPFNTQIPWWDDVLIKQSCLIVRWNVSYLDIFQRPQVSPYCFWYNLDTHHFDQCPPYTQSK